MTQPQNPFAAYAQPAPAQPAAAAAPAQPPAPPPAPPRQPAPPQNATEAAVQAFGDEDPFMAPAPRQERPRLRDMYQRLLLIMPKLLERNVPDPNNPGKTRNRLTADVVVLDGGPLHYGGAPEKTPPIQHNLVAQVPFRVDDMYISANGLISQCRVALQKREAGGMGMVLGRLTTGDQKDPGKNAPWLLAPYTEQDKQVARQYLASVDPFA